MSNYTREYTFIIPPSQGKASSSLRDDVRDCMTAVIDLISRLRQQDKIQGADLGVEWVEIPSSSESSEYRVSIFSSANAVTPEIVEAIRDLAAKLGFTVLLRTAEIQDVFYSGTPEAVQYFIDTYMSVTINSTKITSAPVGAKNAYAKQNCRPLAASAPTEREIDVSAPETKTAILRELGIRNTLYRLKSAVVTVADNTVTCTLEGPRGETTYTMSVDRGVWTKWPTTLEEAINEETIQRILFSNPTRPDR